jgi:REP element-mobilizing transposase RayT
MRFNPQRHARRSIRLKGWDYSQPSWYYVTIVVKDRTCDFGRVVNESVALSELGSSADACWREIPEHHEGVGLDEYVVMPNHVHGIVIINEKSRGDVHGRDVPGRDVQLNVPTGDTLNVPTDDTSRLNVPTDDTLPLNVPTDQNQPRIHRIGNSISPVKGSLSVIIRTFKAAVTTWARANGHPDFTWQGRFHDHIIRDEDDLYRIRTYIRNNPLKWALDQENPDNVGSAQGSS